jgi:predicted lipid carrier protein YhbT
MDLEIIFVPSAFKHGVNEVDLRWAFKRPLYDGPIEHTENKFIRIGFDPHGNLLEMFYNELDDHLVKIFHAMKCRSIFFRLVNQ